MDPAAVHAGWASYSPLTTEEGAAANDMVRSVVVEAFEVTGSVERMGDFLLLHVAPGGIRRR